MTHARFGKLLAVVTLASATPALANPNRPAPVAQAPRVAATAPAPARTAPAFVQHVVNAFAILVGTPVARPRELPSGAPACGNVNSKARNACRELRSTTTTVSK